MSKLWAILFLIFLAIWEAPNIIEALNAPALAKQKADEHIQILKTLNPPIRIITTHD